MAGRFDNFRFTTIPSYPTLRFVLSFVRRWLQQRRFSHVDEGVMS